MEDAVAITSYIDHGTSRQGNSPIVLYREARETGIDNETAHQDHLRRR